MNLLVRNGVSLSGSPLAFAVVDGLIADAVSAADDATEVDAAGATLLPGLHDHHIHLLAAAARRDSVDLAACLDAAAVEAALLARGAGVPGAVPLRAVAYDERAAGLLDREILDRWAPRRPLRVLDRTGALWVLNSAAIDALPASEFPPGAERDCSGRPNGRFWREDAWLGSHFSAAPPPLAPLGRELAGYGVTGATDTGWRNGAAEARTLGAAHLSGDLPQRLTLMGDESLPHGEGYSRGSLKLMIDERDPPEIGALAGRISQARGAGRAVAAHCVTATELALYLAALETAGGARPGDRIEHGGVISGAALGVIARTPLTIVTNPAFLHDRGDRYRAQIPEAEWRDLYRAQSLLTAGVPLAAGSDAPYASADPWLAMRAARDRRTAGGAAIALEECVTADRALALYLGAADAPSGPSRRLTPGNPADFIVCVGSPREVLAELTSDRVALSAIGGRIAFNRV